MKLAIALRWMRRESRGARGRMLYFTACLAVGVAAIVGVAALSQAIENGFRESSREILGADVSVDARRLLPPQLDEIAARHSGVERTDVLETASMVSALGPDGRARRNVLAQVHALTGRYPLYGDLVTEPAGGVAHLAADTALVPADLLRDLELEPGDEILIAGTPFRVAAAILRGPPQFGFSSMLGPRLFVSGEGLKRAPLLFVGSRVRHRALFALGDGATPGDVKALAADFASIEDAAYLDVDTHIDAGPGGRQSRRRLQSFLGLVALLSAIVGGIGVAQIVRAWLAGRTQSIAVLRCLGVRPREILLISLGHTTLLAFAGSSIGAVLGCGLPLLVDALVPNLVPGGLSVTFPAVAVARGMVIGVGIAVCFSLPPLLAIWRVSPARVLRADAAPLPAPRWIAVATALAIGGGVLGAAIVQSDKIAWALWFTAGFAVLVALLALGARALIAAAGLVPRRRLERHLAHGVAALARPGAGTIGAVVALGLGTMVVATMWLVETRLREGLLAQVPPGAPSVFLLDVQPEQRDGVRAALENAAALYVDEVPLVMGRIESIDGRPVDELVAEERAADSHTADSRTVDPSGAKRGPGDRRRRSLRSLTREQRMTTLETLGPSNRVVAGELWSDPDHLELSVEQGFARRLGLELGTRVGFDVGGKPIELRVTSLREVEWQSFSFNFFLVAEPGAFDGASTLYLASGRLPAADEAALQDSVVADFPNVSVLRLGKVIEQVSEMIGRTAAGVGALGTFTVLAALLVLAGAASATALRRRREIALLKTLGVTRAGVVALLATEFGLAGALGGLIGGAGALSLAWAFLTFVAEQSVDLPWSLLPIATLLCGLAAALSGLLASLRALRVRPIEALR